MLRRFSDFKVGALDARRLNEMQDAIVELQRVVSRMPKFEYSSYGPMLARVTQRVDVSRSECVPPSEESRRIDAVIYYFEEVLLRVDGSGNQPSSVDLCVSVRHVPGMMTSQNVAIAVDDVGLVPILVDLGATEYRFQIGDVIPCFRARIDFNAQAGGMSRWREVYVAMSGGMGAIALYRIVNVGSSPGYYSVTSYPVATDQVVSIANIYETSNYYGALSATAPCSTLAPRRLAVGDVVLGFTHQGLLYTLAPTAFDVTCVGCDGLAASTPANFQAADVERQVSSIMLEG